MAIRVDAYTSGGMASGTLARPGALRDALEDDRALRLDEAAWQGLDDLTSRPAGSLAIPSDDVLVAVGNDDPGVPVHANWHHVHLESGPYTLEGELATLPGFDPGRALTRPPGDGRASGERDVPCRPGRDLPEPPADAARCPDRG